MSVKSCAITGHRPTRFKFGYKGNYAGCKRLKKRLYEQFALLYEKGVRRFYVGGSLGVDMWAGEQVLTLKEQVGYDDIELVIILPFDGHDARWDERSKKRMEILRKKCFKCLIVGQEDCRESYIKRNCYMVDHADFLVAVYDNERNLKSGTMQTVHYAEKKGLAITMIHPDTGAVTSSVN